ncbi:uncharacterized protein TRUGW13939_02446 [Talaromyces rugulosus]|uniref:Uncharacterized protein n=1 Tax=Talaromyces rugulosus TaxID=121627 RepID=A0A7H8QN61_TALRU|nr:uncharacterized protein TRUGW13939_02446 [Talaromyces rugulosus]QKX55354.1 hypothetical protein TRUGW13939_02446 [Talaromyces rugulosus]
MIFGTQLDGIALVVGSGRGIGQQCAFSLAKAGVKAVVLADRKGETAKALAEESKTYATHKEYQATTFKINVVDEKSVEDMVEFAVKEFGKIDYCVNAAGPGLIRFASTDIENYDLIMTINAKGMLLGVRAELQAMQKQPPKTFTSRNGTRVR